MSGAGAPQTGNIDGRGLNVVIIAGTWHDTITNGLIAGAERVLNAAQATHRLVRVPGSHEVPWAAHELARRRGCDGVIGLGVLIAGDTRHHELVGESVSHALQRVALATRVPAINGVIVVNSLAQAKARCLGRIARGAEFAAAALEMAALKRRFSQ